MRRLWYSGRTLGNRRRSTFIKDINIRLEEVGLSNTVVRYLLGKGTQGRMQTRRSSKVEMITIGLA